MLKFKSANAFLFIAILMIFIGGCAQSKAPSGKVVATVNGHPIYSEELNKVFNLKRKVNPQFRVTAAVVESEIETLINHRLLIEQAQRMGLDKRQTFVETIKAFWEQTLIKELIAAKNQEFSSGIVAGGDEIVDYYKNLAYQVTFKVIKRKDRNLLEKIIGMEESLIAWQEAVGPVGYLEIKSEVLRNAFEMNEGESNIFKDDDYYYLVHMTEKKPVAVPDLDEIKNEISRRIVMNKQNLMLKSWMKEMRASAKIEIKDTGAVK